MNGRLFGQLVTIVPGTAFAGWGNFAENPSAAGALAPTQAVVNGLPWSGNYYLVDRIHNTEPLNQFIHQHHTAAGFRAEVQGGNQQSNG